MNKLLTGMSIGIVVALVPNALLGEIAKALNITAITQITGMIQSLLAITMGLCVALQFKLPPIQAGTLSIATMIGSGVIRITENGMILKGIGDVINAGLTCAIALIIILFIGDKLKAYTMLLVPTLVITISSFIGLQLLPYVSSVTGYLGSMIETFTTLQPVLMGVLTSVAFSLIILSPVSTVGVAMAISLAGIGSGTANLGITCAGFGMAILGYSVNGMGTSVAHFIGAPKIQMANFVKKPIMALPVVINAAIIGAIGGAFGIQGTPASAGFGISGLIGPINHLNIVGYGSKQLLITVLIFVVLPVSIGFICKYLFMDKYNIVKPEDYYLDF